MDFEYNPFIPDGLAVHINPRVLRMAKTLWSFGHIECSRVKCVVINRFTMHVVEMRSYIS